MPVAVTEIIRNIKSPSHTFKLTPRQEIASEEKNWTDINSGQAAHVVTTSFSSDIIAFGRENGLEELEFANPLAWQKYTGDLFAEKGQHLHVLLNPEKTGQTQSQFISKV